MDNQKGGQILLVRRLCLVALAPAVGLRPRLGLPGNIGAKRRPKRTCLVQRLPPLVHELMEAGRHPCVQYLVPQGKVVHCSNRARGWGRRGPGQPATVFVNAGVILQVLIILAIPTRSAMFDLSGYDLHQRIPAALTDRPITPISVTAVGKFRRQTMLRC